MPKQTETTKKKKQVDHRTRPLAKLLCKQWDDDDWRLGQKIHTIHAKEILALIDGV